MSNSIPAETAHVEHVPPAHMPRLPVLDGWRAVSILTVLQCHIGPYAMAPGVVDITQAFGEFGMAIFFCLSGFLITSSLMYQPHVRVFLIRRVFRIVPAAWLFLLITIPLVPGVVSKHDLLANFGFDMNNLPYYLIPHHGHMWSLSVEMQFYAGIALLFAVLRRKTFALMPFLLVAATALRIQHHHTSSIRTVFISDEIFSGASLAYLFQSRAAGATRRFLRYVPPVLPVALLAFGSSWSPGLAVLEYGRPYWAALAIGATLCQADGLWAKTLSARVLAYIANISYALYLWHPMIQWGLESPPTRVVGYLSAMPLSLVLLLGVAHVSTYYVEKPFIRLGNQLAARWRASGDRTASEA